jgi:hypothetical protein
MMDISEPHNGPTLITVANRRHPSSIDRLKVARNIVAVMAADIFMRALEKISRLELDESVMDVSALEIMETQPVNV